ncbi:MAG: response regulator [Armatimonadetes bacterium]|nr:response regulator [Armatimonadota bacterium]
MGLVEEQLVVPETTTHPRGRVLVVDDEKPIVTILVEVLRSAGFEVTGVDHPAKATALPADSFDIVLTDYKMPGTDGIRLFEELRLSNVHLVGVLVTGFGNTQLVQEAMRRGLNGILLKPFPLERVVATVERALSQRWLNAENERLSAVIEMYSARQSLHRPRNRDELALALAELVRSRLSRCEALVLLADATEGRLYAPRGRSDRAAWADLVDEWSGQSADSVQGGVEPYGDQWLVRLPLTCDGTVEGCLLLRQEGDRPTTSAVERLSLLSSQAALVLSHLRLFESQLREEKLALVGRMAGVICDRVRTPLQAIEAAVAELDLETPDYADMIRDETHHLDRLCAELSDLVSGSDRLVLADTNLAELLLDLAHRVRPEQERRGVQVLCMVSEPLIVPADAGKLTRALHNLVKNAGEAMPQGGVLALGLDREPGQAVITVGDTGVGMSNDVLARVFEPFFSHGKVHGTGLGGAVVRSAVQAHGGRIEVHSREGEGTTFRLYLPLPA